MAFAKGISSLTTIRLWMAASPCAPAITVHSVHLSAHGLPHFRPLTIPGAYGNEAAAAKEGSDPKKPSDDVDDNSSFDTLFDQFLCSPSPVRSPDSTSSELNETTLVNSERNHSRISTEPLKILTTDAASEGDAALGQKGFCGATNMPRL